MARPELSIRTRIAVVFVLLFILCSSITVAAVILLSAFEQKVSFLETVGSYSSEIEEARRNEKNFFLYGTGLPEALASATVAHTYLERNLDQVRAVVGETKYGEMKGSLERYQSLLSELADAEEDGPAGTEAGRRAVELRLRAEGAQLLSDAEEMIDRERSAVTSMLHTSMVVAFGFLGFTLLVMVVFGGFVVRTVVRPLDRFMDYVARIGAGNYEPIQPVRRYRDEFSSLALAFNRMLGEIVTRQDQLVQSGKMAAVGTLTSGIAHELNNPLNNIGLTVEALLDDLETYSEEEQRRMLEQAYTQVERASSTVRNLLDFARKDRSAFTTLSAAEMLRSVHRLVANEIMLSGVKCELRLAEDLPLVRGNPHDLQQVFLNLFLNAIQATSDGGTLTVSAVRSGADSVRVDVSDDGIGIPAEHLEEIFDPFFTTKELGEGTGLGLSVTRSIIERHGGEISVVSEVGQGTTFSVSLPAAEPH